MCGGMQSPSSYTFTIQLSGTQVVGSTCHLTRRRMMTLKRSGKGSMDAWWRIPGGLPSLSCNQKVNFRSYTSIYEAHQP